MRRAALIALTAVAACSDETISGYADETARYELHELNGDPFAARATISFPRKGQARGEAPCNSWSARQTAPYPWFELGSIAITRRACPDLAEETRFLAALAQARIAEVSGDVLILSDETGAEMVFRAIPAP